MSKNTEKITPLYYYGNGGKKDLANMWSAQWNIEHSAAGINDMNFQLFNGVEAGAFKPTTDKEVWRSVVGPWLIISWRDDSASKTYGAHSTFIGKDLESHEALLSEAQRRFPEVFARQKKPIVI